MRQDFYKQLDQLYTSQPQLVESFLREALAQCHREKDSEGIIAVSNELGGFFRGQARYEDSLRCFQEALERMDSLGLTGSTPYLTALMNRAGTLRLANRAEESIADFHQVLALLKGETGDVPYIRASTLNNLGLAYQGLGQLDEAERYVKQALGIIRTLSGMDAELASSGINLASLCLGQNRLNEAEHWIAEAMEYYQSPTGEHDPHLANTYITLAVLRHRQGRLEDSLTCYTKAASVTEHFFGKNQNYDAILHDAELVSQELGRAEGGETI